MNMKFVYLLPPQLVYGAAIKQVWRESILVEHPQLFGDQRFVEECSV